MDNIRSGKTLFTLLIKRYQKQLVAMSLCAVLGACAEGPMQSHPIPSVEATVPTAVVSNVTQTIPMPPAHTPGEYIQTRPYLLGASDVISVSVYLHPELSAPSLGLRPAMAV